MKLKLGVWVTSATLMASAAVFASNDERTFVELPAPMKAHMLHNMRGHLAIIDQLLLLIGEDKLEAAAELAESELGMSSLQKHGASHIAPYYPEAMRQAGTAMHRAASRFALKAQELDRDESIRALQKITAACTACHARYRVN